MSGKTKQSSLQVKTCDTFGPIVISKLYKHTKSTEKNGK